MLYRYSDVLLMMAECENGLGNPCASYINEVRARAYGDNFAGNEYVEGTFAENELAILQERDKEFVGEGKRTVYAKDAYMPEFTKMSIPRIIRDNTFGAVALIDSGMFRYRGSVVRLSPFAIMTTEMTQKLFDQTMLRQQDSTKRIKDRSSFKNPSKPVHNITWRVHEKNRSQNFSLPP